VSNRKVRDREMCKSQNREYAGFRRIAPMLMRSELFNWLLFRALGGENLAQSNRLTNLYP
jgi:hypothetical protein